MTHVALLEGQLQVDCTLDNEHTLHLTVESQASFSGSVSVVSASGSRILHRLQGQTTLTLGLGAEQLPLSLTAARWQAKVNRSRLAQNAKRPLDASGRFFVC